MHNMQELTEMSTINTLKLLQGLHHLPLRSTAKSCGPRKCQIPAAAGSAESLAATNGPANGLEPGAMSPAPNTNGVTNGVGGDSDEEMEVN